LAAAGVTSLFGEPIAGVGVPVPEPELAVLLALADERVHGHLAAAHVGGQLLQFGVGAPVRVLSVADPTELPGAVATVASWRRDDGATTVALRIDVDVVPTERVLPSVRIMPSGPPPWVTPDGDLLEAIEKADRLMFLVGPAVMRARAESGVRALAAVTSAGVLNTWGAKGVFYWQSRHHLATIGLQADDYVLAGVADADLVVVSGLDLRESPRHRWQDLAPSIDVAPNMLAPLAEQAYRSRREIVFPELRSRLVAATAWGYESRRRLPAPSMLTRQYSALIGTLGLVAADPGFAGFFVARTFPTAAPWTICVPPERDVPDVAVAACLVARMRAPGRRCVAVIDGPPRQRTDELLELANRIGVAVVVECWDDDGDTLTAGEHLDRTADALLSESQVISRIAVDRTQLAEFQAAAGEITAWR
jgi:hypothetical protein